MKRILLLSLTLFNLISCEITERIEITEDEMVFYETGVDFSNLAGMFFKSNEIDSLKAIGEFPIREKYRLSEIDEWSKDSKGGYLDEVDKMSDEEKNVLKSYDKTEFQFNIDDNESNIKIQNIPMKIDEFNRYYQKIAEESSKMMKEKEGTSNSLDGIFNLVTISYDGKKFTKKLLNPKIMDENEEIPENLNMFTYVVECHFPKKVKRVNLEHATYSEDRKMVRIKIDYLEYLKNPTNYDLEVEFE